MNKWNKRLQQCRNAATGAFCVQLGTPDSSSAFAVIIIIIACRYSVCEQAPLDSILYLV